MTAEEPAMPDTDAPAFCTYRPVPGERGADTCVECGHALALHIGVEHCPVCELVHLNRQAREASVTPDQVVAGEKSINDYRAARGIPPCTNDVVVHVQPSVPDRAALARAAEELMLRLGHDRARYRR